MPGLPTVFLSYSRKDVKWKNRLVTHLDVLKEAHLLDLWDDSKIGAGEEWVPEIRRAMSVASLAVLMVSADYLASPFILQNEVRFLLERRNEEGLYVFPILFRSVPFDLVDWLRQMQVRPRDGHAIALGSGPQIDADLTEIAREIGLLLSGLKGGPSTPPLATPPPPAPLSPNHVSRARMPATGAYLYGRELELKLLDGAWADSEHTDVVSLVAWGGVGKSTLVNHWLAMMAEQHYCGARRVYCWSFYTHATQESATSADDFIDAALRWFGDADPAAGSPVDKGERLARWMKSERTLLVLDGLEPMQHPPGPDGGRLKSPALAVLVKELAAANPGLCVITTRHPITDLELHSGSTAPIIKLGHLSDAAGAELLRALGVEGSDEDLRQAAREFGGHCLTLNLLGTYLRDVLDGDVRRRHELGPPPPVGEEARRMMESYEKWLGEGPQLSALRLIGLFDRPADPDSIKALLRKPRVEGLNDSLVEIDERVWRQAVAHLREASLLAKDPDHTGHLDAHPLVREYFGQQLERSFPDAWREGHRRLYEHLEQTAVPLPETLEEMNPLLAAVAHGCRAGRHQEVLDEVYWERISRGEKKYLSNKLGAIDANVAALSSFLVGSPRRPVDSIDRHSQAFVLVYLGLDLRLQGFLERAERYIRAGKDILAKIPSYKNATSATVNACRHLSQVYLTMGGLDPALELAREAVDRSGVRTDLYQQVAAQTTLGDVHHMRGEWEDAKIRFAEAQRMREGSDKPLLYHLAGYRYCELLIDLREFDRVLEQTDVTGSWEQDFILGAALNHLSRARALTGRGDYEAAETVMTKALQGLRSAGQQQFIVAGHLAHAALLREKGDLAAAEDALRKAASIVDSTGMKLHEVDCHLERCRIRLAKGERHRARESFETARAAIDRLRYDRRREELVQLDRQLGRD